MSSARPADYRLTPKALADLDDIWRYTAETSSPDQADASIDDLVRTFEVIAATPTLARDRPDFSPPVRIHVHRSHLIVYTVTPDHVAILRLLGGRQNWLAILDALEP